MERLTADLEEFAQQNAGKLFIACCVMALIICWCLYDWWTGGKTYRGKNNAVKRANSSDNFPQTPEDDIDALIASINNPAAAPM